jgi:hypothetical protein
MAEINPPEHLTPRQDILTFDCGIPDLNDWLKKRALPNEESGASRTYVVCSAGKVVGYYALANGGVVLAKAPGRVRRNIGGIRAILVHAISEDAKRFYERYGFTSSPVDPMTLMVTVAEAKKVLLEK